MRRFLSRAANAISEAKRKTEIAKSSNEGGLKLSLINQVSNDLCWTIDTANILYSSKLYVKHRSELAKIIHSVQDQFNVLNSDSQLYGQCQVLRYNLGTELDEVSSGKSGISRVNLIDVLEKESNRQKTLDLQDTQFLKMMVDDYELRYFMGKSTQLKDKLCKIKNAEQTLLLQFLQHQSSGRQALSVNRSELFKLEVPPDAYMASMVSMDRKTDAIEFKFSGEECSFLLKNCEDRELRLRLFECMLNVGNASSVKVLSDLVLMRQQLAEQLDFIDYQSYSFALNSRFFGTMSEQGIQGTKRDKMLMIQKILNASVDRCHAKLDQLFGDEEFYNSLVAKAYPKTDQKVNNFMAALISQTNPAAFDSSKTDSKDRQLGQQLETTLFSSQNLPQNEQLMYSDLIYLRQKILGTPMYKFTLKWTEAVDVVNSVAKRFFNLEFREILQENTQKNQINSSFVESVGDSFQISSALDIEADEQLKDSNSSWKDKEKNLRCFEVISLQNEHQPNKEKEESQDKNPAGKRLGVVYLDLNAYEEAKTHFSRGYCELGFLQQLPQLLVRMNFKVIDNQTELTIDNLITLMHELGHVVHSLVNKHRYQLLANNFKLDYAEICAKIFENLVFLLPASEAPGIFQEEHFLQHTELFRTISQLEQIYYAKLDLFLHEKHADTTIIPQLKEFSSVIQKNIFKQLLRNHDNYWFCNLSFLEDYPGLYFSYAVGEELFLEMQEKKDQAEISSFLKQLFTAAQGTSEISQISSSSFFGYPSQNDK